jgi:hypothetical protein
MEFKIGPLLPTTSTPTGCGSLGAVKSLSFVRPDMNDLALTFKFYDYEIDGKRQPKPHRQSDFVIDGRGMGEVMGFESQRPWFGQTCFEYLPDHAGNIIDELKGLRPVKHSLHEGRFPLYRCHCGAIDCGVVSCIIERTGNIVTWRDVRFEGNHEDAPPDNSIVIAQLEFAIDSYDSTIDAFAVNAAG